MIEDVIANVVASYPSEITRHHNFDNPRTTWQVQTVLNARGKDPSSVSICDIGGGLSTFPRVLAAMNCARVVLVDDFRDSWHHLHTKEVLSGHERVGIEVYSRDVLESGISDLGNFDVITSFDSMEHWHNSPKNVFHQVMDCLLPGGVFFLGVPNCVNLRKRLSTPFGYNKWSTMAYWYEEPVFRAHVREPDVDDLLYIAKDMNLTDVHIFGRNWIGHRHPKRIIRVATSLVDKMLSQFPTLCSDIYLLGKKSYSTQSIFQR